MELAEAVRIVREIVRPLAWARERWSGHGWVRDTEPADALDAVLAALEKPLDVPYTTSCGHEWTMRHTACPTCFVKIKAALRVELGEMALVLEQQTRTLTREHEQRERAEAALIAIRAGSIRLAAAGIVGHLHVVEQCSAALRDPAPAEEDPGLLKLAAQCAPAEEPKP